MEDFYLWASIRIWEKNSKKQVKIVLNTDCGSSTVPYLDSESSSLPSMKWVLVQIILYFREEETEALIGQ